MFCVRTSIQVNNTLRTQQVWSANPNAHGLHMACKFMANVTATTTTEAMATALEMAVTMATATANGHSKKHGNA